ESVVPCLRSMAPHTKTSSARTNRSLSSLQSILRTVSRTCTYWCTASRTGARWPTSRGGGSSGARARAIRCAWGKRSAASRAPRSACTRSRSAYGGCSRSSLSGISAGRSDDRHLAQRAHDAPHVGAVGDHRPARGLHHVAHLRLAHHAARPAGGGDALPWCRSRGDTSGDAVPQIVRGDAHDHPHPSPLHGGDLRADRARGGAVRAGVRAVEALAHRRAVRGVDGVLFVHVIHAIRQEGLQLAARGLERGPGGDVLPAVVPDSAGGTTGGTGAHVIRAIGFPTLNGWARRGTTLKRVRCRYCASALCRAGPRLQPGDRV